MALDVIARAGFGMDVSWRTNKSFTAVYAGLGAPPLVALVASSAANLLHDT